MIQDTIPQLLVELFLGPKLVAEHLRIAREPKDPNDCASDQRPDTTKFLHGSAKFSAKDALGPRQARLVALAGSNVSCSVYH
jgi:hypothetical protein